MRRATLLTAMRPDLHGPQADFAIPAIISERMQGADLAYASAAAVFVRIAQQRKTFEGLNYQKLSEVHEQWPIIGRGDVYYGGTSYENSQGLGIQLPLSGATPPLTWPQVGDFKLPKLGSMAFPVTRLYDQGTTLAPSKLLEIRIGEPYVILNAEDAGRLKLEDGDMVRMIISGSGHSVVVPARLDDKLPERVVLVPRSFGIPIHGPMPVEVKRES